MLRGAPNFRDLGGLRTADGLRVRDGALLRSGHLGELHDEDIALLRARFGEDLAVIDLRGTTERERHVCTVPGADVRSVPIEPSVAKKLDALVEAGQPVTPEITHRFMREAYEGFVRNAGGQFASACAHVAERAGRPVIVHCAAGKDRTGFVVAMLLSALGVPRAAILEDYLLTNERVSPRETGRYAPEIMRVLGLVRAEYLQTVFDAVDVEAGSVDGWLERAGVRAKERAQLRGALLHAEFPEQR